MLTGSGFGDDFRFTHPLRQQSLAEHLVGFMRAAVQQIFALEIQRGVSASRNVLAFGECGWTPGIVFQQVVELSLKGYDELMRVNDEGEKVRVLMKTKKETIRELLFVCTGKEDCTLVQINGKFTKEDIDKLVNQETKKKHGRR